jgi:hypothetical protein
MTMPEDTSKGKRGAEGGNVPEMDEPLDLTPKDDLEGKTLLVQAWREAPSRFLDQKTNAPLGPYLIYDATVMESGDKVSFSGGQVMDDQARKVNEPFRATVRKAKGKRYWQFRKPGA